MVNEIEHRAFIVREIRASGDGEPPKIYGYAAVFNSLSEDLGGFYERIAPGAFTNTLKTEDVRGLFNHDPNYVLGRTKSETLSLSEDDTGLAFSMDPPDTSWARDLLISIRRGDIDQMSFAFRTIRDRWEQVGDQVIRTLLEVKLYDVSPVTFPAYPQTSAQVRSQFEQFLQGQHPGSGQAPNSGPDDASMRQALHAHRSRALDLAEKA
jgi:hypothetical protein